MEQISNWLNDILHISPLIQKKLILTLLIVFALFTARQLILKLVRSRVKTDIHLFYNWRKATSYFVYILMLFALLFLWVDEVKSLSTFLGLLSAGLAIALKDPVSNFFGWLYIIFRKPFEMGDRIQIGKVAGDVVDISMLEFSLMEIGNWVDADQSTGRVIHVPNGKVFITEVTNYNAAFNHIWNEIPILITFDSNWQKAKELLLDIENRRVKEFGPDKKESFYTFQRNLTVHYSKLTPTVYTNVEPYGIKLTIRYLCHPKNRRGSQQIIWEEVLTLFAEQEDVQFAYPSQQIYLSERSDPTSSQH